MTTVSIECCRNSLCAGGHIDHIDHRVGVRIKERREKVMENRNQGKSVGQPADSVDQLRELNRKQAAAIRAKGRMIDNMAYQIRTLSNAIIGFSDLLLTENLEDCQRDFAQEIHQAGKGLSELVNEALDWARLESGRLQIVRTETELPVILDELDKTIRSAAVEKGLAFDIIADTNLPGTLFTDQDRLVKCLINLAANAIQYTEQGFVRIHARPQMRDGALWVRFDVADSGRGITPEKLATIFEPAAEEDDAGAQVVVMLGQKLSATAGLPLTRQLAELLGGTIEVRSEAGSGSTFSLMIPTGVQTDHATPDAEKPALPTAEVSEHHQDAPILLVEDQESNRVVVQLMLQSMGYAVETAVDGQEAVELALSRPYRLIFMDLKMPRMDGYQATRCLRDKNISAPIVALTAMELDAHERGRIGELFDAYLTKPIDSEQLRSAVEHHAVKPAAV